MSDSSQIMQKTWILLIMLLTTNSALSLTLLIKMPGVDIALLLVSVFEVLTILSSILIQCFTHTTSGKKRFISKSLSYFHTTFLIFTTILWVYWNNNAIMNNLISDSIVIRRLEVSYCTTFIVSLIIKSITWSSDICSQKQYNIDDGDIESQTTMAKIESSTLSSNISTSQVPKITRVSQVVKPKDSAQTLVNEKDPISNSIRDISIKNDKNRELNIQLAECINMGETYQLEDTSNLSSSSPNMMLYNFSMPNLAINQSQRKQQNNEYSFYPSTPILDSNHEPNKEMLDLKDLSPLHENPIFHFPSKKNTHSVNNNNLLENNFILNHKEYDDGENDDEFDMITSNNIRMLNISEAPLKQAIHSSPILQFPSSHKSDFNGVNSGSQFKDHYDIGFHDNNFAVDTAPKTPANFLMDELNKEIKENDMHKLRHENSIQSLRSNSTRNAGSFKKQVRNSISLSAMGMSNIKHRNQKSLQMSNNLHTKSNSLSALSINKVKLQSPLKKMLNLRDNVTLSIETEPFYDQDLNLNLANSLRSSPKKKTSTRSFHIRSQSGLPVKKEYRFEDTDTSEDRVDLDTSNSNNHSRIEYVKGLIDQFPNIIKTKRNFSSNTDKSTTSTNSLPSGYYGQYDKEKWQVIKKVSCDYGNYNLNLGNISQLSTSSTISTPVETLRE